MELASNIKHSNFGATGIFVLGLYGSGSSALAGVLDRLGVMMGEQLVPAHPTNPRGHFEDLEFRMHLYRYWDGEASIEPIRNFIDKRNSKYRMWGVKEPLLCAAMRGLWPLLEGGNYKFIIINRDILACAKSYKQKHPKTEVSDNLIFLKKIVNWRADFLSGKKLKVLYVDYNDLTESIEKNVKEIVQFVFEDLETPDRERIESAIDFVEPGLNHGSKYLGN